MSTSYLLDSSVLVQFLKKDTMVLQRFVEAEAVYISTIALGELYYGAEHSDDVQKSLDKVNTLANTINILPVDSTTGKVYGHIKHMQRAKGRMLPDNDLWIAAAAIQYKLTLAARDQHFTWVTGLALEEW
jgi:tRNA(fMet)-specific endonuclease VapC